MIGFWPRRRRPGSTGRRGELARSLAQVERRGGLRVRHPDLHDGARVRAVAGLWSCWRRPRSEVGVARVVVVARVERRERPPARRCRGSASCRRTCEKSTITSARSAGPRSSECWSTLPTLKVVGFWFQVIGWCWTIAGAGRKPPSVPIWIQSRAACLAGRGRRPRGRRSASRPGRPRVRRRRHHLDLGVAGARRVVTTVGVGLVELQVPEAVVGARSGSGSGRPWARPRAWGRRCR